jgi:nucleotide-binding universal stress UspA family protein
MTSSIEQLDAAGSAAQGQGGGRPRVVVGVDGSPGSRAALVHALVAAAGRGADVEVVATYGLGLIYAGGALLDVQDITAIEQDLQARLHAMVRDVLNELSASPGPDVRGLDVTSLVSAQPAAYALLERAEGATLLVVGSRGRGAMRSVLLGSVALHCATHASCPVVVVHPVSPDSRPTGLIVVGVDGSEGSRAALAAAVEEAVRTGAEVEAVVTYMAADYWTDLTTVMTPTTEQIRSDLQQRTQQLVDDLLAQRPAGSSPTVRTNVIEGPAGEVLVHRAGSADLLVVGSRGRGAFRGLLLGSVALHCAMHAPGPVMVVHPIRRGSAAEGPRPEPAMADH